MSREQKLTVVIFIILTIIAVFLFREWKDEKSTYMDFISVWGSFASLGAFVFLFFQVKSQEAVAKDINQKVKETKDLLTRIASVSDVSKGAKIAEQAQTFLRNEQYESALLRVKDLKEIIILIKHYNDQIKVVDELQYRDYISNVTIDLTNISDKVTGRKPSIDNSKIISNLENISTFISDFELKIREHDS